MKHKTPNLVSSKWRILHVGECIEIGDMRNAKVNFTVHGVYAPEADKGGWLTIDGNSAFLCGSVRESDSMWYATRIIKPVRRKAVIA